MGKCKSKFQSNKSLNPISLIAKSEERRFQNVIFSEVLCYSTDSLIKKK